jgi:hypothetical protein
MAGMFGGGIFDDELWRRTIPQLSRQHAAIKYAAIALGAAGSAIHPRLKLITPAILRSQGSSYHESLIYYNRAMKEVRGIGDSDSSLRAVIVSCLLFIAFEALRGDAPAALAHISHGLKMMDEALQNQNVSLGDETLELETLRTFQRLILQSWSCGSVRPRRLQDISWCCRGGRKRELNVDHMPAVFEDVDSARNWWEITQHYVLHRSNLAFQGCLQGNPTADTEEWSRRINEHLNPDADTPGANDAVILQSKLDKSQSRQHFQAVLRRFCDAFRSLYEKALENKHVDYKTYIKAISLRLQYIVISTSVDAPLGCSRLIVAAQTPEYREIVELSRIFIESLPPEHASKSGRQFSMDNGPTWPLFVASHRSRDAEVRDAAIELLIQYPRRDTLWNSRMFAAIALVSRDLERRYLDFGGEDQQWDWMQHQRVYITRNGIGKFSCRMPNEKTGELESKVGSLMPYYAHLMYASPKSDTWQTELSILLYRKNLELAGVLEPS